jgi:hypothetical protein
MDNSASGSYNGYDMDRRACLRSGTARMVRLHLSGRASRQDQATSRLYDTPGARLLYAEKGTVSGWGGSASLRRMV